MSAATSILPGDVGRIAANASTMAPIQLTSGRMTALDGKRPEIATERWNMKPIASAIRIM